MRKALSFLFIFFSLIYGGHTYATDMSDSCVACRMLLQATSAQCNPGSAECTEQQFLYLAERIADSFPSIQSQIAKDMLNNYGSQLYYLFNMGYPAENICEQLKYCGDGSGGGTDPDPDCCAGCVDTDWGDTANEGYQSRQIASCTSCVCSYTTEYRCAEDWHGTTTDGVSGCYECGGIVHDYNNTPMSGVKFYDMQGQLVSESDDVGDFGMSCTEEIIVVLSPNGRNSKVIMTNSIDESLTQHQILLSNNIDLELCPEDETYLSGYYCAGVLHLQCPASADGAPVTSSGVAARALEHACYVPANTPIPGENGMFEYISDCHYTE